MGNVMRGVTPQRSPVARSFFFPNDITTLPKKDIYQVTESVEEARVKLHDYESYQFNFLPSFTAFWKTYLQYANQDIVKQIQCSNEQFIETNMWFNAPNVYISGYGVLSGAPTGPGNITLDAAGSKTKQWFLGTVAGGGGIPGVVADFSLRDAYRALMAIQNDFAAPQFDGVKNMAKDNEGVKGKYVLVISNENWLNWTFDPDVQNLKPLNLDLLFEDFKGSLFGVATCKINRYPMRFSDVDIKDPAGNVLWAAGFPIDPEIFDVTDKKWKPNPYYTSLISAPFEVGWVLGADYAKTVKVGAPPKEFANTNMSAEKFYSLRWNGEVRLTDQVLISYPDGTFDLNHYGKQLKFISELTHGYLNGEVRNAFPFIRMRTRPSVTPT